MLGSFVLFTWCNDYAMQIYKCLRRSIFDMYHCMTCHLVERCSQIKESRLVLVLYNILCFHVSLFVRSKIKLQVSHEYFPLSMSTRWFKPWPFYPRSLEVTNKPLKGSRFHQGQSYRDILQWVSFLGSWRWLWLNGFQVACPKTALTNRKRREPNKQLIYLICWKCRGPKPRFQRFWVVSETGLKIQATNSNTKQF